jgi:hypothetical protein
MAIQRLMLPAVAVLLFGSTAFAATFRTNNFIVEAATEQLAREFGEAAEYYRKVKAKEWLGREMPQWQRPCPLTVHIGPDGPSGATTFDFGQKPIYQFMKINGPKERLLNSVLPHEVTHTVFAYYFQSPVPRWADEGGSVLSEDDIERANHDRMCRALLNQGRAMRLNYLFSLTQYPSDVMVLYAQGFSICRYLVDQTDRATFLKFVGHGQNHGWDSAVQTFYKLPNVSALEQAWIDSLRKPRGKGDAVAARPLRTPAEGTVTSREEVGGARRVMRSTDPPSLPDLTPGSARASGVSLGAPGDRFNSRPSTSRPTHLPERIDSNDATTPLPAPPAVQIPTRPARLGSPSIGPRLP